MWAWLLAAAWPIVKKVLVFLGIGWVTYQGLDLVVGQITGEIQGLWSGLPAAVVQIASLGGIPQAVGILLGALAARATLLAVGKLGKVTA